MNLCDLLLISPPFDTPQIVERTAMARTVGEQGQPVRRGQKPQAEPVRRQTSTMSQPVRRKPR